MHGFGRSTDFNTHMAFYLLLRAVLSLSTYKSLEHSLIT